MGENSNLKTFLLLLLIAFPLRESIVLMIGESTPMRIGELLMGLCPFIYVICKDEYENKITTTSKILFIFLAYSFIFGVLLADHFQSMFAVKYFLRGVLFFFLVKIAETKVVNVSENYVEKLFKYTIVIELVFCLMQMLGVTILFGEFESYNASETFGFKRVSGTASEPGYLIPLLTPCIYYFLSDYKKYKVWVYLSFALVILSLSSFGYVAVLVVILMKLIISDRSGAIKKIVLSGIGILLALYTASIVFPQLSDAYEGVSTKILAFASSNEEDMDYSGAERTENIFVATEALINGSIGDIIFGQGIGATAYYTEANVILYKPAEEANNLYLSVALNQGVIGLLLLLLIFRSVFRQTNKDVASLSFFAGMITQLLQYFIVGNLWLYFLWYYIFFIIALNRQKVETGVATENDNEDKMVEE
ncbi:MAG: O-antigen ligase family protein [Prevotella sp.]|nr:O-antigen ligase family protein [Prevotella sp.]